MPEISIDQATEKLSEALSGMTADDVVAVYNELFPDRPAKEEDVNGDARTLLAEVVEHIRRGLEPEEVLDLWNVVFPKDRNVYYDEEARRVHFNEEELESSEYAE
jgi:hypothetical protein